MESFILAYKMAKKYGKSKQPLLKEAFQTLDRLVEESRHIWITAETYKETLREAVSISSELDQYGIADFRLNGFTVDLWERDEGYGYNLYPHNAEPDEDGDFDEDGLIDGGEIDCDCLVCVFEFIDNETEIKRVA